MTGGHKNLRNHMIFVGSLLLLIGVVIAEEASSRSVPYKHFILPESKRHHLGLVLNSFAWLNIKERDNANEDMNWEVAKYTREWDICWSWGKSCNLTSYPFNKENRI